MGSREKPPRKGETIKASFLQGVYRAAYEQKGVGGNSHQVGDAHTTPKEQKPFLALVTADFDLDASDSSPAAGYGSAIRLFLDPDTNDYDLQRGAAFTCYSHHYLPIIGDRIWVKFDEQSGRYSMLSGSYGQIIRFTFSDFSNESDLEANCTVDASDDGRLLGTTVQVIDATVEGCYFGDETESDLIDRTGYAAFMQYDASGSRAARLEVIALCCPPEGS